jgi:hypothetical protein
MAQDATPRSLTAHSNSSEIYNSYTCQVNACDDAKHAKLIAVEHLELRHACLCTGAQDPTG